MSDDFSVPEAEQILQVLYVREQRVAPVPLEADDRPYVEDLDEFKVEVFDRCRKPILRFLADVIQKERGELYAERSLINQCLKALEGRTHNVDVEAQLRRRDSIEQRITNLDYVISLYEGELT